MEIAQLRKEYTRDGLSEADMPAHPITLFQTWLQQAIEAGVLEPNAMSLATAGMDHLPNLRTVLLKKVDTSGLVFFTNYSSEKARELEANPQAAALFPWLPLERQVKFQGSVEKISKKESLEYFLSRPFGSQLGAWVSRQSSIITSRKILEMKLAEMKQKFSEGKVPLPSFWGGYRIKPCVVEFWQGGPHRLHDRIAYRKVSATGDSWEMSRLAP